MKQIILGTAGHIDHGKTSLIKAVTGVNTDRLKEEKLRGITIELGFASMDLPGGQHVGIVDVPGHEKFVKNMVAGATGIDIVAMVIAADEGVMPQTREHLEICSLLGIEHGFVVLSKIDMVDEEWMELVQEDIRDFVSGTFLEGKPILPVSSVAGKGIKEFVALLSDLSASIPPRPQSSLFRLPVDRVFTMKGFGTVITGTLVSGRVRVGDQIMIYPTGVTSKVRGIQVHNRGVDEAVAGMRTAINFQGLEKSSVLRGEVLSTPGDMKASYMVDVSFNYLSSNKKPVKNRTRVRFHSGTSEILGNLILLEGEELKPGDTTVAQLRLDAPVALVKGDRYVIRSYSPVRAIGGGEVLNPIPVKHKRFRTEIIEGLKGILVDPPESSIGYHVDGAGFKGVTHSELKLMVNIQEKKLSAVMQGLMSKKSVIMTDKESRTYIHENRFNALKEKALDNLRNYHNIHPLKPGMAKEELKSGLPSMGDTKIYNVLMNILIKEGVIVQEEETVRMSDHKISLGADQAEIKKMMKEAYRKSGLRPPYFKDLAMSFNIEPPQAKDVLKIILDEGDVVKAKEDLYFWSEAVDDVRQKLVEYLKKNGEISPPRFKEMTGLSRKYMIPLLEYFDSRNVTIRVGDVRKLRSR